jgi:hypothetical protein
MGLCTGMRAYHLNRMFTALGVLGLLAVHATAGPPAPGGNRTASPQNAGVTATQPTSPPQVYANLAGLSNAPVPGGYTQSGYFTGTPASAWTGLINQWPPGGTLYPGAIGGTLTPQSPFIGRAPNVIVTGGQPPGGFLSATPPGGALGTGIPGGFSLPNNLLPVNNNGVIIAGGAQPGGAQRAGVAPGGVIVGGGSFGVAPIPGTAPGGVIIAGSSLGGTPPAGASPGGVIIAGGSPGGTNAPSGQLR